jgi:hypothetical protein
MRFFLIAGAICSCLWLAGCGGGGGGNSDGGGVVSTSMVVLGYNELGMHCMNQDFSELMILPPFNTLHAQVIERGEEPRIVTSGVTVAYSIPSNTHSSDKTNFWTYAPQLFGVSLAADVGLTGNGLSGNMIPTGDNDWSVTGIPITPILDSGAEDPYPLSTITVTSGGQMVASTQAVVPVSWEISCNICHDTPGISTATDILRKHDEEHGTHLEASKPVKCGQCHAQAPLGLAGNPSLPSLSRAMHNSHSGRMAQAGLAVSCYACHPGIRTKCQRDIHSSKGMDCLDCHGSMSQVASEARRPWVDEPRCGACHTRSGFEFEQAGTLFRNSKGHHGVHCPACHGSPHAITPTTTSPDNVQAIALQGHAGVIDTCAVCHIHRPDEGFEHRLSGD